MLLRAVLPLQVKAQTDRNWPILDLDGNPYVTADGEPRYPTSEEVDQDLRRTGLPINLIKLNFVQLRRSQGMSAAEAMRLEGLNSRLEPLDCENSHPKDAAGDDDEPHTNPPAPSTKESGS
jgi:hypothetical protein